MPTMFTAMRVADLPYPGGLGKGDYKALEIGMRALLGDNDRYMSDLVNRDAFWTEPYQRLMHQHLPARFDAANIVDVAADALSLARSCSTAFGQWIDAEDTAANEIYRAGFPPDPRHQPDTREGLTWRWATSPPRTGYTKREGRVIIDQGRHRLSWLRALIEPIDPDFEVLVCHNDWAHSYAELTAR